MDIDLIVYLSELLECWNNLIPNIKDHIEAAEPLELVQHYSALLKDIEKSRHELALLVDKALADDTLIKINPRLQ